MWFSAVTTAETSLASAATAGASNGRSVLTLSTAAEIPSPASCCAAASARPTRKLLATMATSEPSASRTASPMRNGTRGSGSGAALSSSSRRYTGPSWW